MLLMREKFKGLPLSTDSKSTVTELVIDYRRIQIAALKIKSTGLLGKSNLTPFSNVKDVRDNNVELKENNDSLHQEFTDPKRYGELISKIVMTESKKHLGQVMTYKVNTDTGDILTLWIKTPIHLRALWKNTLLINRSQICDITPNGITVDDNIEESLLRTPSERPLVADSEVIFTKRDV